MEEEERCVLDRVAPVQHQLEELVHVLVSTGRHGGEVITRGVGAGAQAAAPAAAGGHLTGEVGAREGARERGREVRVEGKSPKAKPLNIGTKVEVQSQSAGGWVNDEVVKGREWRTGGVPLLAGEVGVLPQRDPVELEARTLFVLQGARGD